MAVSARRGAVHGDDEPFPLPARAARLSRDRPRRVGFGIDAPTPPRRQRLVRRGCSCDSHIPRAHHAAAAARFVQALCQEQGSGGQEARGGRGGRGGAACPKGGGRRGRVDGRLRGRRVAQGGRPPPRVGEACRGTRRLGRDLTNVPPLSVSCLCTRCFACVREREAANRGVSSFLPFRFCVICDVYFARRQGPQAEARAHLL
mmetsp:Transcript_25175/g.80784  ORF Transcript_25175/g.80784 Transcript_25175/m.80784 type:complete len:203 (+) Transcript_25175:996-1604(+)